MNRGIPKGWEGEVFFCGPHNEAHRVEYAKGQGAAVRCIFKPLFLTIYLNMLENALLVLWFIG